MEQQKMKTLDVYQIGKTLGSGSFGKVKLAVNLQTQRRVAIKMMKNKNKTGMTDEMFNYYMKR